MSSAAGRPVFAVLVNYNGWRDTIECLDSLLATEGGDRLRIIVTDNASTNDSVARLREWASSHAPGFIELADDAGPAGTLPKVSILALSRNRGFAGGNNAAMRLVMALGEPALVWLFNNDMIAAPGAMNAMARDAADERVGCVGAVMLEYDERDVVQAVAGGRISLWHGRSQMLGAGLRASAATKPAGDELDFVSGGCLMTRTDVIQRVGLLDERFFIYTEDADWCRRMRQNGYALTVAMDARVWHKGGRSAAPGSPVHDYHIVTSSILYVRLHRPAALPVALAASIIWFLMPKVVRGQWSRVSSVLRAYRDLL